MQLSYLKFNVICLFFNLIVNGYVFLDVEWKPNIRNIAFF